MTTANKCPDCNLCLDIMYLGNRRFFRCYLCQRIYNLKDNQLVEIKNVDINDRNLVTKIYYKDGSEE